MPVHKAFPQAPGTIHAPSSPLALLSYPGAFMIPGLPAHFKQLQVDVLVFVLLAPNTPELNVYKWAELLKVLLTFY